MPVPKRKRSRARRDSRFANKGLEEVAIARCATVECSAPLIPHQLCRSCGYYRGVQVISGKKDRQVARAKVRLERSAQERQAQAEGVQE